MTKDEKKELIRLAAKAALIDIDKFTGWNPVDDDADAFKLFSSLNFDVQQDADSVLVWYWVDAYQSDADQIVVDVGDDRFAATRLAITQAAAEIGKSK